MTHNKGKGAAVKWLRDHVAYRSDDCIVFPFYRHPNGYGQFGYLGKTHYAHRFMCELKHGPAPSDRHEAAHDCGNGNKGCVNPRHLFWKTQSENRHDALRHGTGVRGAPRGNRGTLTDEQVIKIRALKGKETQAKIAAMFGISEPRVRAIFTGKIYRRSLPPMSSI